MTLPQGFSINPNAADGKTSCSDAEARFGTEEEAQCPEFSKVGTPQPRQLRPPRPRSPATSTSANPSPATATASSSPPTASPPTSSSPARSTPIPRPASSSSPSRTCPRAPFTDFNLHFFGSERGLLATPTQCGTYPVQSTFTPWDAALPEQTSTQFFTLDSGPSGAPCPGSTRPFNPELSGRRRSTAPPAPTPPSHSNSPAPTATRTSAGLTVTTPPGFSATLKGIPYCSDAALAAAAEPQLLGPRRAGQPELPGRQPDRHRHSRRRRRHPPRLPPRQGLPRRPLQGRPAQPRRDHPGGLRPL